MVERSGGPEVKPEVVFVYELIDQVVRGRIRVPDFQRPFVWRRDQMCSLLDSIYREYPIGSLLLWETDTKLSSVSWIGRVKLPEHSDGSVAYLLDGHQRLSTLVGVLAPEDATRFRVPDDEDPERWKIWFNARTEEFDHRGPGESTHYWYFPLNKLMDTVAFLEEADRMRKDGGEEGQEYVGKVQHLARRFQSYKLPVIRIMNTDLNNAVDVFARLNSTGQKMTSDQMVSALTYAEEEPGEVKFRLADRIDELKDLLSGYGFGGLDRTIILRAVLATLREDIYETNWTRLSQRRRTDMQNGLPDAIKPTAAALESAAKFLIDIDVASDRLLPYSMQMVVLSAFFFGCKGAATTEQREFLRRWFWVSSFTGWFSTSNPSRTGWLVTEFREKVSRAARPTTLEHLQLDEPAQPFPSAFDTRSARARALLCMLLGKCPRKPTGERIEEPWRLIAEQGSNAIGYVSTARTIEKELQSSPANRILRVDIRKRGQATSWLTTLGEDVRDEVLRSHGIPPDAYGDLIRGDINTFLRKRMDYLMDLEREFMIRNGVTPPTDRQPMPSAIDTGD